MKAKRGHSGRIEVANGLKHIAALRNTWEAAYRSACKHDGIDEKAKFAVFSKDNPFVVFVDRAAGEMFRAIAEYKAGGYVGLQLQQGRTQS